MVKGMRVSVVKVLPISPVFFSRLTPRQKAIWKMNSYNDVGGSYILPYSEFSDEGIAKWINERFGNGLWVLKTWIGKGKNYRGLFPKKYHYLIMIQIIVTGHDTYEFNVITKQNISRYGAWRDIVFNKMMSMYD